MDSTITIPEPEEIIERYLPLLKVLVAALRDGTRHAREYADWQKEQIDRVLGPSLVRKGAMRFLVNREVAVAEESAEGAEGSIDYETEQLSNLGLAVATDGARFRILKSDQGRLPPPGPSTKRQQFWAQQGSLFPISKSDNGATTGVVNFVLHWNADREYGLSRVYLACPKAGGTSRASVESYWDEPIWPKGMAAIGGTTQAEAEVDDLDIGLDEEEETGTK
jgi:hypothetical protein